MLPEASAFPTAKKNRSLLQEMKSAAAAEGVKSLGQNIQYLPVSM